MLSASMKIVVQRLSIAVFPDGSSNSKEHREVQLLNANFVTKEMTLKIPFCRSTLALKVTNAVTRQPDGSMVRVPDSAIVQRAATKEANSPNKCPEEVAIAFPQVKAGSTLVYDTETRMAASIPRQFTLALTIPRFIPYDEIQIEVTAPMPLAVDSPGVRASRTVAANMTIYRFDYAHPALTFDPEDLIATRDKSAGIYLSSFKTYSDLAKALWQPLFRNAVVTADVQKLADHIVAGAANRREKAKIIYEWVQTNIRYQADLWEYGAAGEPAKVLATRSGDCKDQALLLLVLLKAEGIAADPVLLDVENGYTLPKAPVSVFNHVITYLPEFNLYQDTTDRRTDFGDVPLQEQGRTGLLMNQSGGNAVVLPGAPYTGRWLGGER